MHRREFIKVVGSGIAAAAINRAALAAETNKSPRKPNFLIIMADDMGYADIECYGGEVNTPNLNALAENGLRFKQFYSAARCCPSRASLLTGMYPHRAGVGKMVSKPGDKPKPGPFQGYLNDRCVTFAEALKSAGYKAYMSGKWHVGEHPDHWPRKRGFDKYYGLISGATSYWKIRQDDRDRYFALNDDRIQPEELMEDFYTTDAFGKYAIQWLDEHEDPNKPFVLYLAFNAPHWPLHARERDIAKYRGKYMKGWDKLRQERYERMVKMGIIDPKWKLSPRDPDVPAWEDAEDKEDWDLRMAVYAAMIDCMDQNIGKVVQKLRDMGQLDNTVIMFLVDNGGCHENIEGRKMHDPTKKPGEPGSFVAYRRPWANASNTPFRLFKHYVHEGGIASPFIVHWPEGLPAKGTWTNEIGHINDILPTCLDLAGVEYPRTYEGRDIDPCDGQSLAPIFRGGKNKEPRTIFWEHFNNKAMRQGDWKLVADKHNKKWELYNMVEDRTELNDLSADQPQRARKMMADWDAWAKDVGVDTQ